MVEGVFFDDSKGRQCLEGKVDSLPKLEWIAWGLPGGFGNLLSCVEYL